MINKMQSWKAQAAFGDRGVQLTVTFLVNSCYDLGMTTVPSVLMTGFYCCVYERYEWGTVDELDRVPDANLGDFFLGYSCGVSGTFEKDLRLRLDRELTHCVCRRCQQ